MPFQWCDYFSWCQIALYSPLKARRTHGDLIHEFSQLCNVKCGNAKYKCHTIFKIYRTKNRTFASALLCVLFVFASPDPTRLFLQISVIVAPCTCEYKVYEHEVDGELSSVKHVKTAHAMSRIHFFDWTAEIDVTTHRGFLPSSIGVPGTDWHSSFAVYNFPQKP